jgi:hypothetical protein
MPRDEAGFAGYYLQSQVVRIVATWMGPVLVVCVFAIAAFLARPALWVTLVILSLEAVAVVFRNRLLAVVERESYSWRTGRNSEWEVRKALAEHLGDDFYLLNDVVLPGQGGNIDHIVVGPSGIHLIETKGDIGDVDATGNQLRIRGFPKDEYVRACKQRREALRRFLRDKLPGDSRTYPVYPVIVFTRASAVLSRGTTHGICVEDIAGLLCLLDKYASRRRMDELHRAQVFRALRPLVASAGKRLIPRIGS